MQGGMRTQRQGKQHCARRTESIPHHFDKHYMENLLITQFLRKIYALLRLHLEARTPSNFLISILMQNSVSLINY